MKIMKLWLAAIMMVFISIGTVNAADLQETQNNDIHETVIEFYEEIEDGEKAKDPSEKEKEEMIQEAGEIAPTEEPSEENNIDSLNSQEQNLAEYNLETDPQATQPEVCTEDQTENEEQDNPATPTDLEEKEHENPRRESKNLQGDDFIILYGKTQIQLGDSPEEMIQEIEKNENKHITGEKACNEIYVKSDIAYSSDEFIIQSKLDANGQEITNAISIITENIKTSRGVGVGDSLEKVKKLYGNNYKEMRGMIMYALKGKKKVICFEYDLETQIIIGITYMDNPRISLTKGY